MKTITRLLKTAFILSISGFVACGGNGGHPESTLKIIHNSPDAPPVDVLLNKSELLADVPYGTISEDLSVDAGDNTISINVAGTQTTVIEATLNLLENTKYLVFASDLVSRIKPIVLVSSNTSPQANQSQLRVLHGAPSAPAVDVYALAPDASIENSSPVLQGVTFGQSSDYLLVPSGSYQVKVTLAGTKTVAIDAGIIDLAPGGTYTAYAKDNVGGGAPFSLGLILE